MVGVIGVMDLGTVVFVRRASWRGLGYLMRMMMGGSGLVRGRGWIIGVDEALVFIFYHGLFLR